MFHLCLRLSLLSAFVFLTPQQVFGASPSPTYHRDIAPILFANCTSCHRDGEVAPFPLVKYSDAAKRADWLAENVTNRRMPPWKAEPGFGHFQGERRLADDEVELIQSWAKAGAPEGDPKDSPPLPEFPTGWSMGEPDVVLESPYEVSVPADGPDIFHHVVIPLGDAAGREVAAVEFRPGNARVVHHAVILLDASGLARSKDALSPEPGYLTSGGPGISLAGILNIWAPGVTTHPLPEDVAIKMPAQGDVVIQLHLHPTGKEELDRSRIGIYFKKKPATRFIMDRPLIFGPVTLDIPAGAKDHRVESSIKLPCDLWLTAVLPHMHLLGKEMTVTATLPTGEPCPLIQIKDWDFNWQDQYVYVEPVHLPKGAVIHVSATYDNTSANPSNPRTPPERVLFGESTNEEMCLAIFQAVAKEPGDSEKLRRALISNVMTQIRAPGIPSDVSENLLVHLRELAQSELQASIRNQINARLKKQ